MNGIGTDWLEASARAHPDRVAIIDPEGRLTHAELRERSQAAASALVDRGVDRGDIVGIDLPAGADFAIAFHAAALAGALVQPDARHEGPSVVIDGAFGYEPAEGFRPRHRDPSEPLARIFTSGTSGDPKPIDLTAGNFLSSAVGSRMVLGSHADDRWLCCLPLNHVGGLSILIRSAIYGTAAVIERGFDVGRVASLFEAGEVTMTSLVPTQLVRLLDADAPVERPRLLLVGGGPLPQDVLGEALGRGATVVQTYGLTEACSQVCTLAPEEARSRSGSAGRPIPGTEVRVEAGEILVRGPTVAPGSVGDDGWLHTGDLGRLDDEGYLWVEGRRDDLIVTGGENVRPERVEAALRSHPQVADAGVVGVEDREWGQAVIAFVVAGGELDPRSLREQLRGQLARHEVPKRIEVVGELPRTDSGKLLRRKLL